MNEEEAELLPPYLRPYPPAGAPLGTLSYNRRSKCWVVKGDPSVTEVCKRLFPGSAGSRRGEARFTAHRRAVGDLCWLMMRFPLEIKSSDRALWEKAVTGAREYAVRQAKLSTMPVRMTPPDGAFLGTLRPFQEEGLSYLCSHDRCLLADEMGLGKTVQALAFLSSTGSLPALVIPPAHLTRNWQEETLRFLRVDGKAPRVHTIRGLKPYDLPEADVYIMHYLLLRGWKSVLPTLPFRSVIFDEIQELRHAGTEKYSAASLLSESCERVIGLSGTPIYNRGGEIWNVINILDYHFLGDWESFSREWCSGYGNQLVLKPDLLGAYLRRPAGAGAGLERQGIRPADGARDARRAALETGRPAFGAGAGDAGGIHQPARAAGHWRGESAVCVPICARAAGRRRKSAAVCTPPSGDGHLQAGIEGVFAGVHHRTGDDAGENERG